MEEDRSGRHEEAHAGDAVTPAVNARAEPADEERQPVFNLPGVLMLSLLLIVGIYVIDTYLLDEGLQSEVLIEFAFTPLRYVYPLSAQGLEWLWTPVTYSLLHGSIEHVGFNALWLAAFGAPVARRIGTVRYVLFWILSAAAAAFFHAALNWGEQTVLIGASGVVSALMGAACRFAFPERGGYDRTFGHLYPRQTILGAFRNRTVVIFTVMWLAGNVLIAVGIPLVGGGAGEIAWDAHIGGFLFGFLLFALFDPVPATSRA
jgi:membrane associated rhomboid family serine protease